MNECPIQTARQPLSDFGSADLQKARSRETPIRPRFSGDES